MLKAFINQFLAKKLRVCSIDRQFDTLTFGAAVFKDPTKILQKMHILSNGQVFADLKKSPNVLESTKPSPWFNAREPQTLGTWITAYLEVRLRLFYFGLDKSLLDLPSPYRQREIFVSKWSSLSEKEQLGLIDGALGTGDFHAVVKEDRKLRADENEERMMALMSNLRPNCRARTEREVFHAAKKTILDEYRLKDSKKFVYYMLTCPFKDCTKIDYFLMNRITKDLRNLCLISLKASSAQQKKKKKVRKDVLEEEHPFCLSDNAIDLLLQSETKREEDSGSEKSRDAAGKPPAAAPPPLSLLNRNVSPQNGTRGEETTVEETVRFPLPPCSFVARFCSTQAFIAKENSNSQNSEPHTRPEETLKDEEGHGGDRSQYFSMQSECYKGEEKDLSPFHAENQSTETASATEAFVTIAVDTRKRRKFPSRRTFEPEQVESRGSLDASEPNAADSLPNSSFSLAIGESYHFSARLQSPSVVSGKTIPVFQGVSAMREIQKQPPNKKPKLRKAPNNFGVKLSALRRAAVQPQKIPKTLGQAQPDTHNPKTLESIKDQTSSLAEREGVCEGHQPCSSVSTVDVQQTENWQQTHSKKKQRPRRRTELNPVLKTARPPQQLCIPVVTVKTTWEKSGPMGSRESVESRGFSLRQRLAQGKHFHSLESFHAPAWELEKRVDQRLKTLLAAEVEAVAAQLLTFAQRTELARSIVKERVRTIVSRTFQDAVELIEFGSNATQLTTPQSDIDLGLSHKTARIFSHHVVADMLECLAENLTGTSFVIRVTPILSASVPVVKLEADAQLPFEDADCAPQSQVIKCDIIVLVDEGLGIEHSSLRTTRYLRDAVAQYPTFQKNVLLLKYCLSCLGYSSSSNSGVNSYGLALMYIAVLFLFNLEGERCLGTTLLKFFEFFASFDYINNGLFPGPPVSSIIPKSIYLGQDIGELLVMDPTNIVQKNVTAFCAVFHNVKEFFERVFQHFDNVKKGVIMEFLDKDLSLMETDDRDKQIEQSILEKLLGSYTAEKSLLHTLLHLNA